MGNKTQATWTWRSKNSSCCALAWRLRASGGIARASRHLGANNAPLPHQENGRRHHCLETRSFSPVLRAVGCRALVWALGWQRLIKYRQRRRMAHSAIRLVPALRDIVASALRVVRPPRLGISGGRGLLQAPSGVFCSSFRETLARRLNINIRRCWKPRALERTISVDNAIEHRAPHNK